MRTRAELVVIGRVRAVGRRGLLRVEPLVADLAFDDASLEEIFLGTTLRFRRFRAAELQRRGDVWDLHLPGVDDRGAAFAWRGAEVLLPPERCRPPPAGPLDPRTMLGCAVQDASGRRLGRLETLHKTGAGWMLHIRTEEGSTPFVVPWAACTVELKDDGDPPRLTLSPEASAWFAT